MELAFNRHGFKYQTIHAKFLLREQHQDESFASFHEELWTLCDEMSAILPTGDKDERVNEMRVIDQFAQGLHDRLVRRDVKRFVALNRTNGLLCSMEVLEAATDAAREYAVEEKYMRTFRESSIFLSKRVEVKETNIGMFNINQRAINNRSSDPRDRNREAKCDSDKPSRDLTQQSNFRKRRAVPTVCYNCQQKGHILRNCRNKRVCTQGWRSDSTRIEISRKQRRNNPLCQEESATGSKNSRSTVRNARFQDNVFLSSNSDNFDKMATDTWSNNRSI